MESSIAKKGSLRGATGIHSEMIQYMHTTVLLDDNVHYRVNSYAQLRSISVGQAISGLVRSSPMLRRPTRIVNGLRVFDLPPGSPRVTTKRIRQLESGS
jgi:hypothetical protein